MFLCPTLRLIKALRHLLAQLRIALRNTGDPPHFRIDGRQGLPFVYVQASEQTIQHIILKDGLQHLDRIDICVSIGPADFCRLHDDLLQLF